MSTLYELKGSYQQIYELITEQGEEQVLIDTLSSIEVELEEKADGYVAVIKTLEGNNDAIDKEIKRLQQLKTSNLNGITRLKDSLKDMMLETGKTKFKTALNSYSIRNNAPAVVIHDEALIPKEFFIEQEPKVDKKALKEFLKEHEDFKGAELKSTQSLAVR